MSKKYELGKKNSDGLYRVIALRNFGTIKKGEVGGFVDSKKNLSQEGCCWISGNARVSGNAFVSGNACVYDNARVSGNACVFDNACVSGNAHVSGNACVYDNARVYGDARVSGDACVFGDARVYGDARVSGDACVYGDACVFGHARVFGNAFVSGDACVSGEAHVFQGYINTNFSKEKNKIQHFRYELAKQLGLTTSTDSVYLFKKVIKTDNSNRFVSVYDKKFIYEIGKWINVRNPDMSDKSCTSGLHCGTALYWKSGDTLLEVEVKLRDIITIQEGKVRCKRLRVVGVVNI